MASFGPSRLVASFRSAYGIRKSNVGNGYGRSAECTAVMYSVGRNEKGRSPQKRPNTIILSHLSVDVNYPVVESDGFSLLYHYSGSYL